MPWGVRLSLPAQAHLFNLGMREAEVVSFNLFRLAEDPVELSTRPTRASPLGQEYQFQHASDGVPFNYTVSFLYDEQCEMLLITRIRWELAPR
jgi:hypothetical protein